MAGIGRLRKDKMAQEFFHIFVILNAFQQIHSSVATVETHGQGMLIRFVWIAWSVVW